MVKSLSHPTTPKAKAKPQEQQQDFGTTEDSMEFLRNKSKHFPRLTN